MLTRKPSGNASKTKLPPRHNSWEYRRYLGDFVRSNSKAHPNKNKTAAVRSDMRPGAEIKTDGETSRKKSWSRCKLTPSRYSRRVSSPIRPAMNASSCPARLRKGLLYSRSEERRVG